ncbi:MAG: ABC transporter permease, partial [Sciscionella sp.]
IVVFSVLKPSTFATVGDLQSILTTQAALLVLAATLTVSLGAGEFDLSIAGVVSLSAIIVAKVAAADGAAAGLLVSLVASLLIGSVNSLVIVKFRANSFIVTLAMGTLLAGIGQGFSGSMTLGDVPDGVTKLMTGTWLGVGYPFWITAVIAIIVWAFLEHTPTGRYVFFTGEGRQAALLAGVRVNQIRVMSLIVTSLGAWAAGIMLAGQTDAANSTFGDPYLLQAFAAAFLGAATIKAGRFNVVGTVIAVLLLAVGTTGLQLFGLASWVTNVFDGAVLIIAITFASVVSHSRPR